MTPPPASHLSLLCLCPRSKKSGKGKIERGLEWEANQAIASDFRWYISVQSLFSAAARSVRFLTISPGPGPGSYKTSVGPGLALSQFSSIARPARIDIAGPGPCKIGAGLGPCPALSFNLPPRSQGFLREATPSKLFVYGYHANYNATNAFELTIHHKKLCLDCQICQLERLC
ncbi:hypothetical protein RchiOBHm_Chr4g0422931 [Rosa chinensis]|uniref:Uncharacterized protein n=1 Tax=Rosa chinensis TaxID=74649 RepID=A0A2P6QYL9_ROSCH|nr:hypothetical protein RchiOBHm_Chr4g0422931 [Rosa chinensis]